MHAYSSDIEAHGTISTPCGTVQISVGNGAVYACTFAVKPMPSYGISPVLDAAQRQLERYFAGALTVFDLPLNPVGTPFQQAVWHTMMEIPYGETITYSELARRIGRPTATRAVAAACGANPIAIIIPCHRVIAAHDIGGYTPGIPIKQHLLHLETVNKPTK
ncbi:MAG: methylated-DNA--[protein]-cysteine S-methyltransferase [Muribaculaceae bacterium]